MSTGDCSHVVSEKLLFKAIRRGLVFARDGARLTSTTTSVAKSDADRALVCRRSLFRLGLCADASGPATWSGTEDEVTLVSFQLRFARLRTGVLLYKLIYKQR